MKLRVATLTDARRGARLSASEQRAFHRAEVTIAKGMKAFVAVGYMRRYVPIGLCLLLPLTARANPYTLDPSSLLAFGVVAFWAFVVEAGVVALLLTFSGLAPLRIFGGYFVTNLAVFCFIFYPLLRRVPMPVLEALVVVEVTHNFRNNPTPHPPEIADLWTPPPPATPMLDLCGEFMCDTVKSRRHFQPEEKTVPIVHVPILWINHTTVCGGKC
jgi:hypothetical protein